MQITTKNDYRGQSIYSQVLCLVIRYDTRLSDFGLSEWLISVQWINYFILVLEWKFS